MRRTIDDMTEDDWEHSLGDHPRGGRWQDATGVGEPESRLLGRARDLLQRRLAADKKAAA